MLALSHCALTARLLEAFLATFVVLENCFLAGALLPALSLSFLKQISALFPGLVLTIWSHLWLKGGESMIFRDYFLTQNREQIKKYRKRS